MTKHDLPPHFPVQIEHKWRSRHTCEVSLDQQSLLFWLTNQHQSFAFLWVALHMCSIKSMWAGDQCQDISPKPWERGLSAPEVCTEAAIFHCSSTKIWTNALDLVVKLVEVKGDGLAYASGRGRNSVLREGLGLEPPLGIWFLYVCCLLSLFQSQMI